STPHAYEKKDGNQDELPEHEEEEKIRGREKPDHRRLRDQQRDVELAHSGLDRGPRDPDTQHAQQRSQKDKWQTDAIHTHAVSYIQRRDPAGGLDELQSA